MSNETSGDFRATVKRIVVATDYSPAARKAVGRAGRLAQEHSAYLHLVHAQPDWNLFSQTASSTAEQYNAVMAHAEDALRLELAWLETTFGVAARGENRTGRASEVLRSVVREIEPHLVIAGAHGEHHTADMAPLLGGTALKLVASAPVPTLIVRSADAPYRNALAAVGTQREGARRLIRWAHALIRDGDCHIVHAFDVPYAARLRAHGMTEARLHACQMEVHQGASAVVEELVSAAGENGLRLHAHLICGEPVSVVLAEIENRSPDLVILGKHQLPPRDLRLASLGGIALRIAYHAPGDVLIVP
jgi:universal stress protein E